MAAETSENRIPGMNVQGLTIKTDPQTIASMTKVRDELRTQYEAGKLRQEKAFYQIQQEHRARILGEIPS